MLILYKPRAKIAATISFSAFILYSLLISFFSFPDKYEGSYLYAIGAILVWTAIFGLIYLHWFCAKAKGFSGWFGLLFLPFFIVGLFILLFCFKDKYPNRDTKFLSDNADADVPAIETGNSVAIKQKWWSAMNDKVKIALIIGGAAIICVGLWIYFSPYHSCVRGGEAPILCAHGLPSR